MKLNFWAFIYLSLIIITIQSCVLDNNTLTPTSQFTITFEKGPLAGQNIELISNNSSYDLQFYTQKLSTKISAQPLEEKSQNSLAQSSSINWAWLGDEVEGNFKASFFSDPNVNTSGDIELAYKNNDYITCSIPKNAAITINSYGNVGETVDGELNFIGVIDYNYNMVNKREPTMVTVKFSIVRGPDSN